MTLLESKLDENLYFYRYVFSRHLKSVRNLIERLFQEEDAVEAEE